MSTEERDVEEFAHGGSPREWRDEAGQGPRILAAGIDSDGKAQAVVVGNEKDLARVAEVLDSVEQHYATLPDALKAKIDAQNAQRTETVEYLIAQADRIRQASDARIALLAAQGIQVQIPGVDMLKFGVLLDMLIGPEGSVGRASYELAVQTAIQAELDRVEQQTARAKLLAPGSVPNGPAAGGLFVAGR